MDGNTDFEDFGDRFKNLLIKNHKRFLSAKLRPPNFIRQLPERNTGTPA
jgi:hypothetical protein